MADEFRHPGSAILIVALEIVAVEKSQVLTIGVENLKHPHIGLVDGKVMPLFEGDAIELIGGVKDAVLQYTVEFEVGLYLRIIDVVAGFADLLGVEVPVIGLNLEATLLGIDDGLDVFRFASGLCSGGGDDGIHELQRGFRCFGHLIFELPRGKGRIAEEFRFLRAELRQASDGVTGVIGVATFGAVPGVFEDGLTRLAIAK